MNYFCKLSDYVFAVRRKKLWERVRLRLASSERRILALSLFALLLHLVFSFSPPPSLFCVSSLQMWLREPLPWQSTQRNLLLWVILRWTSSYTSGRDQTHVPTEPRAQEHLVAIILSPPPLSPSARPPPPPHPHVPIASTPPRQMELFGALAQGDGGACSVTEWLVAQMSGASEGASDWAHRRRDGGVKKILSAQQPSHSVACPLVHSSIWRVDFMLLGRCLSVRYIKEEEEGEEGQEGDARRRILRPRLHKDGIFWNRPF